MLKILHKLPKLCLFLCGFIVVFVFLAFFIANLFQAKSNASQETVRFVIPKGQALSVIATRLQEENLIKNKWAFRFAVYKNNLANKIQAGSFELSASMDTWQIANALTVGTDDVWITLPEGWRREEIAESLSKQGLSSFDQTEFLNLSKGLEGQLFPDTYLVPREITSEALLSLFKNTFASKVTSPLSEELSKSKLSLNEILTLASLVQRESGNDEEMPLVAQVLFNRLDLEMPLQVDATLQYVKGFNKAENSWWSTPLGEDKELNSLYNTYQHSGLPPGPICNPGLAAIKAVLNPTPTQALYYLHDSAGKIHLANTLETHNSNVNKYLR
ncbi:MAG TPA: endolytic transglycosylase MltG [Candidatus Woesebacteria bacterium]|nr:endolytic transglycosylase MltG [Candidatus Woesebacteria bacterium]